MSSLRLPVQLIHHHMKLPSSRIFISTRPTIVRTFLPVASRTISTPTTVRPTSFRLSTQTIRNMSSSSTAATTQTLNLTEPSLFKSQGFINGEWVNAKSGKTFKVHNPATGKLLGEVPEMGSVEETENAINVAAEAFKTWKNTSPKVCIDQNLLLMLVMGC
jgi:delta 1-pyrroline-5-carboxylate dehydrogenase